MGFILEEELITLEELHEYKEFVRAKLDGLEHRILNLENTVRPKRERTKTSKECITFDPNKHYSQQTVSAKLGVGMSTLFAWRKKRKGPKSIKGKNDGKKMTFYNIKDVDDNAMIFNKWKGHPTLCDEDDMTLSQVAEYLGTDIDKINVWRAKKHLPCFTINKFLRFNKNIIDIWVRENAHILDKEVKKEYRNGQK